MPLDEVPRSSVPTSASALLSSDEQSTVQRCRSGPGRLASNDTSAATRATNSVPEMSSSLTIPMSCSSPFCQPSPGDDIPTPYLIHPGQSDVTTLEARIDALSRQVQNLEARVTTDLQMIMQHLSQLVELSTVSSAVLPTDGETVARPVTEMTLQSLQRPSSLQSRLALDRIKNRPFRKAISLQCTPSPKEDLKVKPSSRSLDLGRSLEEPLLEDDTHLISSEPPETQCSDQHTKSPSTVHEETQYQPDSWNQPQPQVIQPVQSSRTQSDMRLVKEEHLLAPPGGTLSTSKEIDLKSSTDSKTSDV
ncbi:uncharacterized protein LOC143234241 [Tachypleus tridentatus]|uniref:uncharacterized protein LOC143234241 n=1 Tax=Tachypleus tridentatus TaxID=6853 RepID=UPI003FCEF38E